jgi:DUF4097 and DUF4098 domain-containing protein YvlB
MSGTLTDWAALKYNLNIESTVDLTQTSSILPLGTSLTGVGNFKGKVSGEGDKYRVEGVVDSQALTAAGVYLKAVNVAATVEGTNSNYEANGRAVAEMLTFEDFRIDFVKMAGRVRGTGSDFRWLGELEAAAARSKSLSLGGLFLSDAMAEYKDNQFTAAVGNGRTQKFAIGDTEFAALAARNLRIAARDGNVTISAPNAQASSYTTKDYKINGITGRDINVKTGGGRTDVNAAGLTAADAEVSKTKLRDLSASEFQFTDRPGGIDLRAKNVRASKLNGDNLEIAGLETPEVTLTDTTGGDTVIYSDSVRTASINAGGAILGSLNVAGVRLTIRQGTITGTSNDIDAGNIELREGKGLPNGNLNAVKIVKPVFVVEPAGRYRVTADMSLGGGILGSIELGAAKANVAVNNDQVALTGLDAVVMDGKVVGDAVIAFNERNRSDISADFTGLDLSKLVALQTGNVVPLRGKVTGRADITMAGRNSKTLTGKILADVEANAGKADVAETDRVPLNGRVELTASNGLINVDQANLKTTKSTVNATGQVDLARDNSDLTVALN